MKEVPVGYANNFLLKNKYAVEATPGNLKQLDAQNQRIEKDKEQHLIDAQNLKEKLEALEVEVKAKSGDGGRLFGSVSTKQIVEALKEQHGIKIDKRKWICRTASEVWVTQMYPLNFITRCQAR